MGVISVGAYWQGGSHNLGRTVEKNETPKQTADLLVGRMDSGSHFELRPDRCQLAHGLIYSVADPR
jgi:hypothetical protein